MGQSTPTTTMAFDDFAQRYAQFRAELHPREQPWFDRLLEAARRHSNAINRRPHMDFERPVMLAMLMENARELEETRQELDVARLQLRETCKAMEEHGLMHRRPKRSFAELKVYGQRQLIS